MDARIAAQLEQAAIFIDHSNLWFGLQDYAAFHRPWELSPRLHVERLVSLMCAGRELTAVYTVVNVLVPEPVRRPFRQFGPVDVLEPGLLSGREQGNDQALLERIYHWSSRATAGTIVLGTGDGAGWQQERGFFEAAKIVHAAGKRVEQVGWAASINRVMAAWVLDHGGAVIELDRYYDSITFDEGGRRPVGLSLRHRPTAGPCPLCRSDAPDRGLAA